MADSIKNREWIGYIRGYVTRDGKTVLTYDIRFDEDFGLAEAYRSIIEEFSKVVNA